MDEEHYPHGKPHRPRLGHRYQPGTGRKRTEGQGLPAKRAVTAPRPDQNGQWPVLGAADIPMPILRILAENQKVGYTVSQGPKGPQADQVHTL